jgi:tetratricopeptide (TPR) repeat protein
VKRAGRGKLFLVGGVVLALAAGGGWYLMTHRDRLFPNSQPPAPPAAQQDVIARATALHDQGKTTIAIAQLRRVPTGDPLYEKAQALITQWQAADQQQQSGPATATTPTAAGPTVRDTLLESARVAYTGREFLKAQKLLEQAAALAPLEGVAAEQLTDVHKQVAPLQESIAFIKQGEYEIALRGLWRLHEADRANRDISQLMVDSYYNLGVKALQREAPAEAVESFNEALGLDPKDGDAQRLAHFADAYLSRAQDLQYKIFVKYLTTRT